MKSIYAYARRLEAGGVVRKKEAERCWIHDFVSEDGTTFAILSYVESRTFHRVPLSALLATEEEGQPLSPKGKFPG